MAIRTTANAADRIEVSAASSIDNLSAFTWMMWVRPTTTPGDSQILMSKSGGGGTGFEKQMVTRTGLAWQFDRNTDSTVQVARTDTAAGSILTVSAWNFIAAVVPTVGTTPKLYIGTATTPVAEVAGYHVASNGGAGTPRDDSDQPLRISNGWGSMAWSVPADYGPVAVVARQLTLAELRAWQFSPRVIPDTRFLIRPGDNGLSTQRDLSGNGNHGTVTNGTVVAGAPLPRWRRGRTLYVPASAPPAEVSGTASGSLAFGGSATVTVPVTATASGSLTIGGSADATVGNPPVLVTASGALSFAGAALALVAITGSASGSLAIAGSSDVAVGPTVTVDTGTTYQVMSGWEVTGQIGQTDYDDYDWAQDACEAAVAVGINRVRLEIYSGAESDDDWFQEWRDGSIDTTTWQSKRYPTVNDDGDPDTITPAGFHWSQLDRHVTAVVNPMRALLAARGESLYVNLCYVAFGTESTSHVHEDPDEYAEFILATFQHLDTTYGWVPDAVEVILEPDTNTFFKTTGGTLVGQACAAAGAKLDAAGYTGVEFILPSTTAMSAADNYFDAAWAVTAARPYIAEIAYHRYSGVSDAALGNIATRVTTHGLRSGMLEHIGSGVEDLYKDLTLGLASSWQQFALAYPGSGTSSGGILFTVQGTPPATIATNDLTHALALYFRNVRMGATRVAATSVDANVRPTAFLNPWGTVTAVLHCDAAGDYIVAGLPAGRYNLARAYASADASDLGEITVAGDGRAYLTVPDACVVAIEPLGEAFAYGSLTFGGSATASTGVSATATGALALTGSAAGTVAVVASGSGALALTGSAVADVVVAGTASGSIALTGTAVVTVPVTATASGTLSLAGSGAAAIGDPPVAGTASGSLGLTGSAAGTVAVTATASGALTFGGSAVGTQPVTGAASGALGLSGASTGAVAVTGAGSGNLALSGTATATTAPTATGTGALVLAGSATATVAVTGAASGSLGITGGATATTTVAILQSFTVAILTSPRYRMEIDAAPGFTMDLGGG